MAGCPARVEIETNCLRPEPLNLNPLIDALASELPAVVRWSGAVAKGLRKFNVAVEGKSSGSTNTDALTLADLTVQELLVSALRDGDPLFRSCRIEGEEDTGDMRLFDVESELAIAIDPIDGTRQYRDRTGDGYAVMVQLQSRKTVHYSLVFIPESGPHGTWVEVREGRIVCGPDDPDRTARTVLDGLPPIDPLSRPRSNKVYLIGFQDQDPVKAQLVTDAGLEGFTSETMAGSIYPLMAEGRFAGSLIHSPNIYDFPVSMQIARALGGDALWVHDRAPVDFSFVWNDEKANMLRFPGIVACSEYADVLDTLCALAQDWNPVRYAP
ncbi:MAG: inositol monophosphatase family protein [Planctomycetaceae bacterium]